MNNTRDPEAEAPRRGSGKEARGRETPVAQGLTHGRRLQSAHPWASPVWDP